MTLLVWMIWPAGLGADQRSTIRLQSHVTVASESVRLAQVADIEAASARREDTLGRIEIGRAPLPGRSQLIHQREIERRLKQNGFELDQYRLIAAGPVKVTRDFKEIAPEKICSAVKAFIRQHAPWKADQMKINTRKCAQSVKVPAGQVSLRVVAPKHTDWLGGVPFNVLVMVNGQMEKKVSVPAYIDVWSEVVLAAKPLGKYQPLTAKEIKVVKKNLTRVPANALLRPDQVIGRRTNRAIAANAILRSDQIELPPMVKKGDVVQVLAESAILKITTQGICQEDGAKGERIKVINLRSKKFIYAQVVDAQTVQVNF